jgi:hypothetical protein
MVRPIILAFVLVAGPLAAEPVDLTPHSESVDFDGGRMQRNYFLQGSNRIGYDLPGGWATSGGGSSLTLTPPNKVQATAVIECLPLSAPQIYNEAQIKTLREKAASFIPAKAENITAVSETLNGFKVEGHDVLEIITAYSFYGQAFKIGVIYINAGENQLRCHVVAHAADFDAVYNQFHRSLFTWNTMN